MQNSERNLENVFLLTLGPFYSILFGMIVLGLFNDFCPCSECNLFLSLQENACMFLQDLRLLDISQRKKILKQNFK